MNRSFMGIGGIDYHPSDSKVMVARKQGFQASSQYWMKVLLIGALIVFWDWNCLAQSGPTCVAAEYQKPGNRGDGRYGRLILKVDGQFEWYIGRYFYKDFVGVYVVEGPYSATSSTIELGEGRLNRSKSKVADPYWSDVFDEALDVLDYKYEKASLSYNVTTKELGGNWQLVRSLCTDESEASKGGSKQLPVTQIQYTAYQDDTDRLKDQFIQQFSEPSSYNAYAAGMNTKRRGEALVRDQMKKLENSSSLVSNDPQELIQSYNSRYANIESIQQSLEESFNAYSFETGQEIGNSLNNQDYESAMMQGLGYLNSSLEKKEAEKALEEKKQQVYQERLNTMRGYYANAYQSNMLKRQELLQLSAYEETEELEMYYWYYVQNIDCHNNSMKGNFSTTDLSWMENHCSVPSMPFRTTNEKSPAVIARRKYQLYQTTAEPIYLDAAIGFMSMAVNTESKKEHYRDLATYFSHRDELKALNNIVVAKNLAGKADQEISQLELLLLSSVLDSLNLAYLRWVPAGSTEGADMGSPRNFKFAAYYDQLFSLGLSNYLLPDGKPIYYRAVVDDREQLVLHLLELYQKYQPEQYKTDINKMIALASSTNAYRSIYLMSKEGISLKESVKGKSPLKIAKESGSLDAYYWIATANSDEKSRLDADQLIKTEENGRFSHASSVDLRVVWKSYIDRYSNRLPYNTQHLDEANKRLAEIIEHDQYDSLMAAPTYDAAKAYLQKYPASPREEVRKLYLDLLFDKAEAHYGEKDYYNATPLFTEYVDKQLEETPSKARALKRLKAIGWFDYYADFWTLDLDTRGNVGTSMNLVGNGVGYTFGFYFNPVQLFNYIDVPKVENDLDENQILNGNELDFGHLFSIRFDLNMKVAKRIWPYVGIGFGSFEYGYEVDDLSFTQPNGEPEKWSFRNEDKSGWYAYMRVGANVPITKKFILRVGGNLGRMSSAELGISYSTNVW